MFLHLSVSHSVQKGGVPLTETSPWTETPPGQGPHLSHMVNSIRKASYWNAFLSEVF